VTALKNWEQIQLDGAIISKRELKKRNGKFIALGNEAHDQQCGTDDWVHLCFHPNQPMFYKKVPKQHRGSVVVLDLALETAICGSVVFSTENAVAGYAHLGPSIDDLRRLDLSCFSHEWFTSETKSAWQAEVLIHPAISTERILRVRNYADVLEEHQLRVPMGAKLNFLHRPLEY
jgi:hypothetical protein